MATRLGLREACSICRLYESFRLWLSGPTRPVKREKENKGRKSLFSCKDAVSLKERQVAPLRLPERVTVNIPL